MKLTFFYVKVYIADKKMVPNSAKERKKNHGAEFRCIYFEIHGISHDLVWKDV